MNGKGSKQRPGNREAYRKNFDRIFRKKRDPKTKPVAIVHYGFRMDGNACVANTYTHLERWGKD